VIKFERSRHNGPVIGDDRPASVTGSRKKMTSDVNENSGSDVEVIEAAAKRTVNIHAVHDSDDESVDSRNSQPAQLAVRAIDYDSQTCFFTNGARLSVCSDCMNVNKRSIQQQDHITLRRCRIDDGHIRAEENLTLDQATRDDLNELTDYYEATGARLAFMCDIGNRQSAAEMRIKHLDQDKNKCTLTKGPTKLLCCQVCAAAKKTLVYCRGDNAHTACNHDFDVNDSLKSSSQPVKRHRWDLTESFREGLKAMWTFCDNLPIPVGQVTQEQFENYPANQFLDNGYSRSVTVGGHVLKVCKYCNLQEHLLKRSLLRQCRLIRKHDEVNWDGTFSGRKWHLNMEEAHLVKATLDGWEGKRSISSASSASAAISSHNVQQDTIDAADEDSQADVEVFGLDFSSQVCYFTNQSLLGLCPECQLSFDSLKGKAGRSTLRRCRVDYGHPGGTSIHLNGQAVRDLIALSKYCEEGRHQVAFMCDVRNKRNAQSLVIDKIFRHYNRCTLDEKGGELKCCDECQAANMSLKYCRAEKCHTGPNHQFNSATSLKRCKLVKRHNWDLTNEFKAKLKAMWIFAEHQPIPVDRVSLEEYESYPSNRQLLGGNSYTKTVVVDGYELKVCCYCNLEEHCKKRSMLWKCRIHMGHSAANWDASFSCRGWYPSKAHIEHVKRALADDRFGGQSNTPSAQKRKNLQCSTNSSKNPSKNTKRVQDESIVVYVDDDEDGNSEGLGYSILRNEANDINRSYESDMDRDTAQDILSVDEDAESLDISNTFFSSGLLGIMDNDLLPKDDGAEPESQDQKRSRIEDTLC
jgi:hypothetical protein